MSKQPPEKPAESAKKKWNLLFRPKYRAEQFLNKFYASGNMLHCKFRLHNVDWKRINICAKTTCNLKPMWKTRKAPFLHRTLLMMWFGRKCKVILNVKLGHKCSSKYVSLVNVYNWAPLASLCLAGWGLPQADVNQPTNDAVGGDGSMLSGQIMCRWPNKLVCTFDQRNYTRRKSTLSRGKSGFLI